MNAKLIFIPIVISTIAFSFFYGEKFQDPKDPIKSARNETIEAQRNEETATKNRMEAEDKLSQAILDSCYAESLAITGIRFAQKQRKTYDCWKQNTTNINSGTVASAISEVPPNSIIPIPNASIKSNLGRSTQNIPNANAIQGAKEINSKPVGKVQKTNFLNLATTGSGGKGSERSKGSIQKVCPTKTILRRGWNDPRVQYAYNLSCGDMDFIKTIEAESKWDINAIGDGGKSFGLCQIHKGYNRIMQKQYKALTSDNEKVLFCYKQYQDWVSREVIKTRLYGYNVRNLPQNKNSFTFK